MPHRAACRKPSCHLYSPKADELCEPHEEQQRERHRDKLMSCDHCHKVFLAGAFDQHRISIYYREKFYPRGRAVKI